MRVLVLFLLVSGCSTSTSELSDQPKLAAETLPEPALIASEPVTRSTVPPSSTMPDQEPLPSSAIEMVDAIEQAETAIVDQSYSGEKLEAWGRRQQMLYQILDKKTEWAADVEAGISEDNRPSFDLNWKAKKALSSLVNTEEQTDTMPAWRLVNPVSAEELVGYYKEAEEQTGVGWEYIAAINLVETRMGRIDGVSSAGATGPMQFLPTTWAECCEGDPAEPRDAILGAAKYLTDRGAPENMSKAILGYNNSEFYVEAITSYAKVIAADEFVYNSYHSWEVYFQTSAGVIRMPADYDEAEPMPVDEWLVGNPEALFVVET